MKGMVRIVRGAVDRHILRVSEGDRWRWGDICRSDRDDSDVFNCVASNPAEWKAQYHYCGMPLDEAEKVGLVFPARSASEAWVEWRATGLVRVVVLHHNGNNSFRDGPRCPWNLGPVWEPVWKGGKE